MMIKFNNPDFKNLMMSWCLSNGRWLIQGAAGLPASLTELDRMSQCPCVTVIDKACIYNASLSCCICISFCNKECLGCANQNFPLATKSEN